MDNTIKEALEEQAVELDKQFLTAEINKLKNARAILENRKEELKKYQEQIDDPKLNTLIASVDYAKERVKEYDELVRTTTLKLGALDPRVSIKTMKDAIIDDYNKAVKWCITNMTPALKIDESYFKKAVKDGVVPEDIGHVEETSKVFIAKEL